MIDSINYEGGGARAIEFAPSKLQYNKHGVPVLSTKQIEEIAYELLQTHCPNVLHKPAATPVAEIILKLHERTGLLFAMENLGYAGKAKVLGKVCFNKKTLYLDTSLEQERKAAFRFTAAHEIGHWVLHRYNYKKWKFETHLPIVDGLQDDDSTLCRLDQRTQSDWLEFQANVFAASLVMPREMFVVALKQTQFHIGVQKNIGHIYLSSAPSSHRDYGTIISQLSQIFQVSRASVRVRTKTLRLVEGEDKTESKSCRINPFTILASL
jgi:Zn-dependent peptidase ImmA (M78 family)